MSKLSLLLDHCATRPHVPLAIVGNPGGGKTAQIQQWCADHQLPMVKLITSQMDETDVAGIMALDGQRAKQYAPNWVDRLGDRGVLFLDEFNCGRKEVMDTLLTLIANREIAATGEKLGDGVLIVAAMNDAEQCDNYDLSPAMRSRFMWAELKTNFNDFYNFILNKSGEASAPVMPLREYMTFDAWLTKFRTDPAYQEDKKLLLEEIRRLGFEFTDDAEVVTEKHPTCARQLANLLYWTRTAQDVIMWCPGFLSKKSCEIIQSVRMTALKTVGNTLFGNRTQQTVNEAEDEAIQQSADILSRIQQAAQV